MKATIKKVRTGWRLKYDTVDAVYLFFDGACNHLAQLQKIQKALDRLRFIDSTNLTVKEYEFIEHMSISNCAKITKRQYGYLTGLYQRHKLKTY